PRSHRRPISTNGPRPWRTGCGPPPAWTRDPAGGLGHCQSLLVLTARSPVAQRQSIRLLTGRLLVRIQSGEPQAPDSQRFRGFLLLGEGDSPRIQDSGLYALACAA